MGTSGMYPFYVGVYEVVDDPSVDSVISWSKSNKSFVIWDPEELFEKKILSSFFRGNLSNFINALDTYGFVRIEGSERLEFGHKQYFVRGKPELLKKMRAQAAMDRFKKSPKPCFVMEKRVLNGKDLIVRFDQIFGSSTKAKTPPLENSFQHLQIKE
ncbi:unnamed protein product [Eruca vesicaria subsp. sativa]|uniref:HSF-type DNA-binding domain-containing protein n=1 Tax=Eruca vesicaria subsp. sativa TaxID=29727 RepID=A0ABC8JX59_ERUVS|nr:unnamed protein product [Eruca vesicaria subsp. sativa]